MCARHSLGPGAQALHPGDTAGCHFDEGDRAFVLSMSSRGGLPPEKGLKCGSPCAARKVSDAEGTPEAGRGQSCWRDSCKSQRNGRTRHCLNDPPSSFSWQKEDIQSAGGHGQKASFVVPPPPKVLAAPQALLCQCSPLVRVKVSTHCQQGLFCRKQRGNSQGSKHQVHQVQVLDHQEALW